MGHLQLRLSCPSEKIIEGLLRLRYNLLVNVIGPNELRASDMRLNCGMRQSTSLRCLVLRLVEILSISALLPSPIDQATTFLEAIDDRCRAWNNSAVL